MAFGAESDLAVVASPAGAGDMGWGHLKVPGGTRVSCPRGKPASPCQTEAKLNCSKAAAPSRQTPAPGGERRVEGANHPGQRVAISCKHCHGLVPLWPGPEAEVMARGKWWVCLGHSRMGHQGKGPGQHWGETCTKEGHGGRGQACPKMSDGVWGWSRRREPQSWLRGQRDPEPRCPLRWRR